MEVKDFPRFGARWCVSFNTVETHRPTQYCFFFVCFDGGETSSIHPSIFSYTVISRDSGLQEVLEPIPAVNGERWSWVGNMSKQHQTAQKENYTAAIINVKSSLKLTEKIKIKINQRLNLMDEDFEKFL